MQIDIQTLIFIHCLVNVLLALVFLIVYLTSRAYPGPGWWLLWSSLTALGFIAMLVRPMLAGPWMPLSILLTNCLLVGGLLCLLVGILRFLEVKVRTAALLAMCAVFLLCTVAFLYVVPDENARSTSLYICIAVISLLAFWGLESHRMRAIASIGRFMSMLFLLHGCYYTLRAAAALTVFPVESLLTPSVAQSATFLVPLVANFLWGFFLVIMVSQRARQEIVEARDQFRFIFSTGPDAASITRLGDGRLVEVNERFERMLGWSRAEVIGKPVRDINLWARTEDLEGFVRTIEEKGFAENLEFDFTRKDGAVINLMLSARRIMMNGVPHIISVARDVTERRKRDEERQERIARLQAIVENNRMLPGFIPICAECKRIRNDAGGWEQVEAYVTRYSGTRFSHGLCPDCLKRLYAEIASQ